MKLTLDWNCVIEVEEGRPQAAAVRDLVNAHQRGEFEVALLAASASENNKSKRFPGNGTIFKERVARLGWQELPIVPMPGVWGLSYWDYCYWLDDADAFEMNMNAIWRVIAPKVKTEPEEHLPAGETLDDEAFQSEALAKWRNTWCDVMSAYCHTHEKRDVFVTNNTRDFQANAAALAELGMRHISSPAMTRELIASLVLS